MSYDSNDIYSAALCCWKEARAQGFGGMLAVLHCIKNRLASPDFPKTLHDIIYGKNQFTSMSVPSDPEFNLDPNKSIGADGRMWAYAGELAGGVFDLGNGVVEEPDIVGGAVWYANESQVGDGWYRKNGELYR